MALKLSTNFRNQMLKAGGQSAVDMMAKGCLEIRSGGQPATADDSATGTLLARITLNSGDYTDLVTNGLSMQAVGAVLNIKTGETWSGLGLADGDAGWFRLFDTTYNGSGGSTTGRNIDGLVGTATAELILPSVTVSIGSTVSIDTLSINFPSA